MPLCNPADLLSSLKPRSSLLGLDVGRKTLGIAIADESLVLASPLVSLVRTKLTADLAQLRRIIDERSVGGIVLGLPINMDGTEGPMARYVRQFAGVLDRAFPSLPIALWDERLSTAAVTRTLLEADLSRRQRQKVVDRAAAAYILQGVLDFLRMQPRSPARRN
ncbi:MAG: Holliday junction resolvase RuvX [Alphaproteobacteria bacterium]